MKMSYRTEANARAIARVYGKSLDKPNPFWSVTASSDDQEEILIYDYIGWPFNDPYEFASHIKGLDGKPVTLRINSPGGDVFDGLAIFSSIRDYTGKVTSRIEGLAASMASVIALGASDVQAHKYAMYMIHEPLVCMCGNQYELGAAVDLLSKISVNFVDIYAQKAGLNKKADIKEKMKDTTWFTAEEAKKYGFLDTVIDKPAVKAGFDLSIFANVPDGLVPEDTGKKLTEREIERALRDAGASRSFARAFVSGQTKVLRDAEAQDDVFDCINNTINILKG